MPKIGVTGANIAYEAFGTGPTVIWVQAPWGGCNPFAYFFACRFSENCRTIIWDGPNTGEADFVFRDSPSEWHLFCDFLHGLCRELEESPAYFAGPSGGGELALHMAHLYPEDVKGIVVYRPTDTNTDAEKASIHARYHTLADAAENGGMEEVLRISENPPSTRWGSLSGWLAKIARNPDYRKRIMETDPHFFATVLRKWGDWMGARGFHRANLTDGELSNIRIPTLIYPSDDPHHPEKLARELLELLPDATWTDGTGKRTEEEMYNMPGEEHAFGAAVDLLPHVQEFIERVEARDGERAVD